MNKKFLVTGGAGFIGTNLVMHLRAQGYDVAILDDFSAGKRERVPSDVMVHEADVCDTKAVCEAAKGMDFIFHLAALPSVQFSLENPIAAHRVNVDGTLSVLEAARSAGSPRVIFTSSAAVYGDVEACPIDESVSKNPKSPYGLHKYIGEQLMTLWSEQYDVETVSLRLFNVYGPHMDPEGAYAAVVGKFLKQHEEGKSLTIVGTGEQTRDFIHVKDVARAFLAAALSDDVGNGEVCNIGSGKEVSIKTIADLIGGDIEHLPLRVEPMRSCADISRAQRILTWQPEIPLADGLRELV